MFSARAREQQCFRATYLKRDANLFGIAKGKRDQAKKKCKANKKKKGSLWSLGLVCSLKLECFKKIDLNINMELFLLTILTFGAY